MAYIVEHQYSLFDEPTSTYNPGDWIDRPGQELTFDQACQMVGQLIVTDKSTESHAWYKVERLENVIERDGSRRLILYDGKPQRGLEDERYFKSGKVPYCGGKFPYRAYRLPDMAVTV